MATKAKRVIYSGLLPGEQLDLSISLFVKHRGNEAWIKAGGVAIVQPEETGEDTADRLSAFLAEQLELQADDLVEMFDS